MRVRGSKLHSAGWLSAVLILVSAAPRPVLRANAPIVVTNADDSGVGSLRWAIDQANATPGSDTIVFQIPFKDLHTIWVASPLPTITDTVLIDGSSQPGYCCRELPILELDGSGAGPGTDGLVVTSNNSTIQSLVIVRFGGAGIHITGSAYGNQVFNCWIGIDYQDWFVGHPNYDDPVRNEVGVLIDQNANTNSIGGADHLGNSFDRNVIAGNKHGGVRIEGNAQTNAVVNNHIGTDVDALFLMGNGSPYGDVDPYGVKLTGAASNNFIGSPPGLRIGDRTKGNVIAGAGAGVLIDGTGGNFVQDNYIGLDKSGFATLPNFVGIQITGGALGNIIGARDTDVYASTFGNVISRNRNNGVLVDGDQTRGNSIRDNSIFDNGTDVGLGPNDGHYSLGIQLGPSISRLPNDVLDVDEGPNHLQNWPVVGKVVNDNFASSTTYGALFSEPLRTYTIDVYEDETCHGLLPWLSNAEWWYGSQVVKTDQNGVADFAIHLSGAIPENLFITAIATSDDGSSSEIGPCHAVNQPDTADMVALPDPPTFGNGTGSFIVSVMNQGPSTAREVVLADTLPRGLTFASCQATHGGVCGGSGNQRFISFRSLGPGQAATVTISATLNPVAVPPPGDTAFGGGLAVSATGGVTFVNTVMVTSDAFDPNPFDNVASMTLTIGGPDTQPPVISGAAAHPDELWPPDGRLHEVRVAYGVTDNVDPRSALTCSLSVGGAGVTAADAAVLGDHAVRLRASRPGTGPSDYAVTISCADRAGNIGIQTIHVPVARENRGRDGRDR